MAADWQPATQLERDLLQARRDDDQQAYLAVLGRSALLFPDTGSGWVTGNADGRTYLLAYTSASLVQRAYGGSEVPYRSIPVSELTRTWPDPAWWLAVDPGTPIEVYLPVTAFAGSAPAPPETVTPGVPAEQRSAASPPPAEQAVSTPSSTPASTSPGDAGRAGLEVLPDPPRPQRFRPVNDVEEALYSAIGRGDTDSVLKSLLLAELLVPIPDAASPDVSLLSGQFQWRLYDSDGETCVPVFTSSVRCSAVLGDVPTTLTEGITLVHSWPDPTASLVLNPGTPIGASLPGPQVVELASWAAEIGLIDILHEAHPTAGPGDGRTAEASPAVVEAEASPAVAETPATAAPGREVRPRLQMVVSPAHVAHYLDRGYDLVSGPTHRVDTVGERIPPAQLLAKLGVAEPGAPDGSAYLIRWTGYGDGRYGGTDVTPAGPVPQVRVSGVRLPYGAELWRVDAGGQETLLAGYDSDVRAWRRV